MARFTRSVTYFPIIKTLNQKTFIQKVIYSISFDFVVGISNIIFLTEKVEFDRQGERSPE